MKAMIRRRILCLVILMFFLSTVFVLSKDTNVKAASSSPDILITEVMPMSQSTDDSFEYIELYNNTDYSIDLKNYKLIYPYYDFTASKIIPARGTLVVCMRNNTLLQNFNAYYGSILNNDNYTVLPFATEVLDNNLAQSVILTKDDGTVVSAARFEKVDFDLKRSVVFKYPQSGFDMIKLGVKQNPTPGSVSQDQIPVQTINVTGVVLDKSSVALEVGKAAILTPNVFPSNATNKSIVWSTSNYNIATVESNGVVIGRAPGQVIITARTVDGNYAASCTVTVSNPITIVPVTGITLDRVAASLDLGKTTILYPTVFPSNATNKSLVWSTSNYNITTVENNGAVIGRSPGQAIITARTVDGNYAASCTITVLNITIPVTGITIDRTSLSLDVGKACALFSNVLPSNATNKSLIWSTSNYTVATVESNGVVIARAPGQALITARTVDGNYAASCTVTVTNPIIHVTGITLDRASMILDAGKASTLTPYIYPSNAVNKAVVWSTSNYNVATVESSGVVIGRAPGQAIITARTVDGNYAASCTVTVNNPMGIIPVTGIALNIYNTEMLAGTSQGLTATVLPVNASNKSVLWNSSNPRIVTVDSYGFVRALKPGIAIITAKTADGGFTARCNITVKNSEYNNVTGIKLNKQLITIREGKQEKLNAVISPGNAKNKAVIWKCSNNNAYVTADGRVTGVHRGTAIITVTTVDGNYIARCVVVVVDKKGKKW